MTTRSSTQSKTQSRRRFLRSSIGSATAIGIGAAIPSCFAQAADMKSSSSDNILIVVQMSGGNDGLNTVVPFDDDAYRAARPKLAIPSSDVVKCDREVGFHPSMSGLHSLFEAGQLAVVQGVGYEHPNRSHFEAMDIWHTCKRKDEQREDGWLGRFLDSQRKPSGGDVSALHLGDEQQPFAVASRNVRVPTVRDLAEFQLRGKDRKQLLSFLNKNLAAESSASTKPNELLSFLESSTTLALAASARVTEAVKEYRPEANYPDSALAQKMKVIAQLIDAGLTTKIYYVQLDGFDTHAQQPQTHSILLREWSEAISALIRDLQAHNHADRVCVMTFSEFGRRVAENASEGTDHGAAGPMFLCGRGIQGGILGDRPNLTDLQDGDLKFQIDFRQVYASILKSWLGTDPKPILGRSFAELPLFAQA